MTAMAVVSGQWSVDDRFGLITGHGPLATYNFGLMHETGVVPLT
jgi:hypothetical protein